MTRQRDKGAGEAAQDGAATAGKSEEHATPGDSVHACGPEQPEWTQEESIQYEVARELIRGLMAYRSQWIFDEEQSSAPDTAAIARWRSQQAQYASELRGLDVRDRDRIERICRDCGAELRRLHAGEKAT